MLVASAVPASAAPSASRTAAVQQAKAGSFSTPVTGTLGGVQQDGTLTIKRFSHRAHHIFAVGTLNMAGGSAPVRVPVSFGDQAAAAPNAAAATDAAAAATCPILHLTLGPLDLNLLGLTVHLNQVVLNIDAQSGPGNLLGNLLCAVAGLLDGGGPLSAITALLNQILSILSGLNV
jgi:hypothetical protein